MKKEVTGKLVINKKTVANLSNEEMQHPKGGGTVTACAPSCLSIGACTILTCDTCIDTCQSCDPNMCN